MVVTINYRLGAFRLSSAHPAFETESPHHSYPGNYGVRSTRIARAPSGCSATSPRLAATARVCSSSASRRGRKQTCALAGVPAAPRLLSRAMMLSLACSTRFALELARQHERVCREDAPGAQARPASPACLRSKSAVGHRRSLPGALATPRARTSPIYYETIDGWVLTENPELTPLAKGQTQPPSR